MTVLRVCLWQVSVSCQCEAGYSGVRCERNPCTDFDCNGGQIHVQRGLCSVVPPNISAGTAARASCDCYTAYMGDHCEHDACQHDVCHGHGTCRVVDLTPVCAEGVIDLSRQIY